MVTCVMTNDIEHDITDLIHPGAQPRSSEANFINLFDALGDMVLIASTDGRIIYANTAVAKRFGYLVGELTEMHVLEIYAPELRDSAQDVFEEILGGRRTICELPILTCKGNSIPVETRVWVGNWKGSPSVFGLIKEMTQRVEIKERTLLPSAIKSVLMELATHFINLPLLEIGSGISASLAMMGEILPADRVYVFNCDFGNQVATVTYEWCRKGIAPQIDQLRAIPADTFSEWLEQHLRGNGILFEHIDDYHADDDTEAMLESHHIKSLVRIPMMQGDHCVGFVSFDSFRDYRVYTDDEIKLLKIFARILVNVLNREHEEIMIRNSLEEKSLLMKELNHRVKNNLNIVSSLLYLQSQNVSDPEARRAMSDSENRIKAMALLHESIYRADDSAGFNLKNYVESITRHEITNYNMKKVVKIIINMEDIRIMSELAIPVGLIINELLTNALQHAFTRRKHGRIGILLSRNQGGRLVLKIEDDGVGIDYVLAKEKKSSIGIQLVEGLVRQLRGTMTVKSQPQQGTVFTIVFAASKE